MDDIKCANCGGTVFRVINLPDTKLVNLRQIPESDKLFIIPIKYRKQIFVCADCDAELEQEYDVAKKEEPKIEHGMSADSKDCDLADRLVHWMRH